MTEAQKQKLEAQLWKIANELRGKMDADEFFDETWQNYTWLFNTNGHDVGEYSMRIILSDTVFTGQFTLGDF